MSRDTTDLKIRPARHEDREFVLGVQNDPATLANSGRRREIHINEHLRWWTRALNPDSRMHLFIAELAGSRIGFGRLDWLRNGDMEVSIALAKAVRGSGLGKDVLHLLVEQAKDMGAKNVVARIRTDNWISSRLFKGENFEPGADTIWWRRGVG